MALQQLRKGGHPRQRKKCLHLFPFVLLGQKLSSDARKKISSHQYAEIVTGSTDFLLCSFMHNQIKLTSCLVLSCFFRVHPLGGLFLAHAEAGLHCTVLSITPPWAGCSGLMHLNHLGELCGSYSCIARPASLSICLQAIVYSHKYTSAAQKARVARWPSLCAHQCLP